MDQNLLDEMLGRISTLESDNQKIRQEIKAKKEKIQQKIKINNLTENLEKFEQGKKYLKIE